MVGKTFLATFLGFALANVGLGETEDDNTVVLPDSCKDLPDGEYFFKLLEDGIMSSDGALVEGTDLDPNDFEDSQHPIIKAKCSNGYLIIDVNYDSNMMQYFTSWDKWHASIGGPSNADIVDWDNWYKKSRIDPENNKFLLSPDCNTCEESHVRQHFDEKTTYWMSGNLFGCFWMFLGKHNCDLDKDTYACYECSASSSPDTNGDATEITEDTDPTAYYYTGQCATAIRSSDSQVTSSHDTCQLGLDWTVADTVFGAEYEKDYETNNLNRENYSKFSKRLAHQQRALLDTSDDDSDYAAFSASDFEAEIFKPSLGTDGRFCVCSQTAETNYVTVSVDDLQDSMNAFGDDLNTFDQFKDKLDGINVEIKEQTKISDDSKKTKKTKTKTSLNNRVELRHEDFEAGTYRIREAGTYVIMEDIEFNFNAGSMDDPQAEGAWKPWASQVEEYPGAESGRDEYFLGFFAGITIECDDVVLDLNNKRIAMSEVFYHQQRWFTVISLTSQFFLPGNGPGFFGYDPQSASNVVIKDGTIGLSSHFGIHGNYNKNVLIENVHVESFEVHGMQFNGFENLQIIDTEVGPSSTQAFFTGEYGHMRFVLDRLNKMIADLEELGTIDDAFMNFYGRERTHVREIAGRTERMMNFAFDYVMQGRELAQTDFEDEESYEEYKDAIDIFVNPSGIPYASVLHGIFLNTKEASVMTYNLLTTTYSETAYLENVKIHDLQHSFEERVRMYNDIYMFFGPFLNCLNARQLLGDDVVDNSVNENYFGQSDVEIPYQYKGSIVTDVYLTLTKYSNNWDYLEKMLTGVHVLVPWAEGETALPPSTNIACNMDVMIHSGKGTTGLRLDGVTDITVKGLEIYNLHDETPSGETVCGEYYKFMTDSGGGHLAQQMPMQEGFSGNKVQAVTFNSAVNTVIEDVYIHDLESDTGPIMGLAVWPANDLTIKGELKFENFKPSSKLDFNNDDASITTYYPNQDHFACAIYLYESYLSTPVSLSSTQYTTDVTFDDVTSVSSCGIENSRASSDVRTACYNYVWAPGNDDFVDKGDVNYARDDYAFDVNVNDYDCESSTATTMKKKQQQKVISETKKFGVVTEGISKSQGGAYDSNTNKILAIGGFSFVLIGAVIAYFVRSNGMKAKDDSMSGLNSYGSVL